MKARKLAKIYISEMTDADGSEIADVQAAAQKDGTVRIADEWNGDPQHLDKDGAKALGEFLLEFAAS